MSTYSAPPNSQGTGSRVNPLAPVAYTPQSSYVPSASKKSNTFQRPISTISTTYTHHSNLSSTSTTL
ncbi:hypothetical protein BG011_004435, partial [Mortierella polycephala]